MHTCKRIEHLEHIGVPKPIIYYVSITPKNAIMVKDAVPHDQLRHIDVGDEMSVYAVIGSVENVPRRLTIWYNKEVAAIETSEGSIWGDWDEDVGLLLTEEFEQAEDEYSIGGRIAHNLLGHRGIYSSGNFYLLTNFRRHDHQQA
jgi:hypothetical protein